jgi:DnaK suppressor protein
MSTQAKQQSISGFQPYVESKGEEYMGKPMREHFSKILKQWKQDLMQEVDRTVDHMKDEAANFPEYGWCESCGVEIGIRRLEARPTADLCVDCKTLAEIKEKQVGK